MKRMRCHFRLDLFGIHVTSMVQDRQFSLLTLVLIALAINLVYITNAVAQGRVITGAIVSSADGLPLPGVNILSKATTIGTASDVDGRYTLTVPSNATVLVFSFLGFKTQEIEIGEKSVIDVSLESDVTQLSEVVVTATGVPVEKRKLGVALDVVKSDEFPLVPTASIDQTLIGRIPGAQISSVVGTPGSEVSILLRGINSVNRGTAPMIMLDGVQLAATNLSSIDPASIERVEVVQGASAASIYGAQGANGVIQLFTKKGKQGAIRVDASISWTTSEFLNIGDLRKAKLHGYGTNANNEIVDVAGDPIALNTTDLIYSGNVQYDPFNTATTFSKPYDRNLLYIDHFDVFLRAASIYNARVAVSGGSEKTDFSISVSNNHHQSNFATDGYNDRTNLNLNYGVQLAKGIRLQSITQLIYNHNTIEIHEKQDFGFNGNTFDFLNSRPFVDYQIQDIEGNHGYFYGLAGGQNYRNPFYRKQYSSTIDKKSDILQNARLTYTITKNFNAELLYGINHQTREVRYEALNQSQNLNQNSIDDWVNVNNGNDNTGEITLYDINRTFQNFKATGIVLLDFPRDFGWTLPLRSSTQISFDYRNDQKELRESYATGMPVDPPLTMPAGNTFNIPKDFEERFVTYGYLLSQRFELGDIAALTAGFRSDYSSAFGRGSKPFTFPRADGFFRISGLQFWNSGNISNFIVDWKIRTAYGEAGIQPKPFDRYRTLSVRSLGESTAYYIGFNQSNPDLGVEISKEFEIGTDLTIDGFDGNWLKSFQASFTYWKRATDNGIVSVDRPPSTGTGLGLDNALGLESKGMQVSLLTKVHSSKKFKWDLTVNFSKQRSIVSHVTGGELVVGTRLLRDGDDVGEYYVNLLLHDVNQVGPDGTPFIPEDERQNYSVASNGWVVNNETKRPFITDEKFGMGNPNPKFMMSFINDINLNQLITLSVQVDWLQGYNLYNNAKEWMYRDGVHSDYEKEFAINGESGAWTAFYRGVYNFNQGWEKNYFIEDATFTRVRNISLNFNINRIFKISKINQLNLMVSGRNLFTISRYTGMDPETSSWDNESVWYGSNSPLYRGIDDSSQPNFKSYQITLNIGI